MYKRLVKKKSKLTLPFFQTHNYDGANFDAVELTLSNICQNLSTALNSTLLKSHKL